MFGPPVEDDERNPEADAKFKPAPTKAYSNLEPRDPNADVADETSYSIGKGIDLNIEVVGQGQLVLILELLQRCYCFDQSRGNDVECPESCMDC